MSDLPIWRYDPAPPPDKCWHHDVIAAPITIETTCGTYRTSRDIPYCRECGALTRDVTTNIKPEEDL